MADNSKITWTDATWSPIVGCSKVSEGCQNCYAEKMAGRLAAMNQRAYQDVVKSPDLRYGPRCTWNGQTHFVESALTQPLHWRKPRKIFVCSMSDLFHENNPDEWIDRVFAVMALCPQHTFQVLTKRAERMKNYATALVEGKRKLGDSLKHIGREGIVGRVGILNAFGVKIGQGHGLPPYQPLPNVMLGVSVENQPAADERIPHLLATPARWRFLSCEPLLGAVDISHSDDGRYVTQLNGGYRIDCHAEPDRAVTQAGIDLVIAGGESGPKARPCNVEWIRSIIRQCKAAGVPCFVKQLGANSHWNEDSMREVGGITDPKGGNPDEWPADLRVREWVKDGAK